MANNRPLLARLSLEVLEAREVPASSPWMLETFDQTALGSLPANWSSHGPAGFAVSPDAALGSDAGLRGDGASNTQTRVWSNLALPADAQVSANVLLDSLVPAQIIARGQRLNTDAPSYYAVSVTRGLQVQLLKVINGQSSVLASLKSSGWLSNQWIRVSLTTVGDDLYVQLFRTDTAQYLGADGSWQYSSAQALHVRDSALNAGGNAGLARNSQYAGAVRFDNFMTAPPPADLAPHTVIEESFSRPLPGGLPPGWVQWSDGAANLRVSTVNALTENAGLRATSANAGDVRAWLAADEPANSDVSAAVFVESLAPSLIIGRGQNLATDHPSYYAAAITRGIGLQLLRAVNGQVTVLGSLHSKQWLGGQWTQVTLSMNGDDLRIQVYRTDTAQYLDSAGNWSAAPAWALNVHDSAIPGSGKAGLGRLGSVSGMATFDSFTITRPAAIPSSTITSAGEGFDQTATGTLPAGWAQWRSNTSGSFQVSDQEGRTSVHSLMSSGGSDLNAHAWLSQSHGADVQVAADVFLNSLVPAQLFLRGRGLSSNAPSYYAVGITRGVDVQILRVQSGRTAVLSDLQSNTWDSNIWAHVTLTADGDTLQVQVRRYDSGQYLNQDGDWQTDPAIAMSVSDSALSAGGVVGLVRPASYSGAVFYDNFSVQDLSTSTPAPQPSAAPPATTPPPPVHDPTPVPAPPAALPAIARHYSHIRIAEFAYQGTPLGTFERGLLQNSVDLVIPNTDYLNKISTVASATPQFIYSNASNLYRELLTDWLNFADERGYSREAAFYHVTQATPFTGHSASAWPVNWFWRVAVGSTGNWSDFTSQAHSTDSGLITFGALGQAVLIGNIEKFREINVSLTQGALAGWHGVLEYASAVDSAGRPTAWKTLHPINDGTAGLTRSGRITFDPPADWVTASPDGKPLLFMVRIRTTSGGIAPVAQEILGRDYVNANGGDRGTIPAFDSLADANGDGYLSDAEYSQRRPGFDARFVYETRAFYPAYGQNRFATNVANAQFREWAADYSLRYLQANPQADGLFMDNSLSKIALDPTTIAESLDHYADNYADLLAAINRKIAPKWVLANIAGGGAAVDGLARRGISYLDEFALRPMAASYSQFEDVAANLQRRLSLSGGKSYAILDSLVSSMSDPRAQLATLAYYYLLADPNQTMLVFNGGNDPAGAWSQHWSRAAAYDVGQPLGAWGVYAQGIDPADASLAFKVYERPYANALVLYKPLSYFRGKAGSTDNDTATTHWLNGSYRPLNADGTLGAAVTKVTLRNGEGAILVKV